MPRSSAVAVVFAVFLAPALLGQSFQNFESALVHPIRVSADGSLLFVTNTPDNRLEVYSLADPANPLLIRVIPVGLEPVSVTPRTNDEVWVANNLSDSVSIVSLAAGCVIATLPAKDEPADVIFAGSPQRAFVTTTASDAVLVFDPVTRALVATVAIPGKDPAALAKNAAGDRVYALVKRSGNKTTIIPASAAPPPPPPTNTSLPAPPQVGLIVSSTDPAWTSQIPYTMPDNDVVEINASTFAVTRTFTGVGTTNWDLAVHPTTGTLYVINTDARNLVRFEPNVRAHAIDTRVTTITTGLTPVVTPIDLNPGINYATLPNPAARATALSEATSIVIDGPGGLVYVAAGGTDRVGVLNTAGVVQSLIEISTATGSTVNSAAKKGPRALALHPSAPRLYVLNRMAPSIDVIDTVTRTVIRETTLSFDPTPAAIRDGRKFLYDAKLSGNGTMSCAACHIDGDVDGMAWDLGDPGGTLAAPPTQPFPFNIGLTNFHPMKGPMTTQSLRGLGGTSPLHWRGDRTNFQAFNGAFSSLMGGSQLSATDMNTYAGFATNVFYPPNPNQNLDRTYPNTPAGQSAQDGFTTFTTFNAANGIPGGATCSTCHALPPGGTNNMVITNQILQESQEMNVPQLRNIYRKQGFLNAAGSVKAGFGMIHDGSIDTPIDFVNLPVFNAWPASAKPGLAAFVAAFDTGTAPTVGVQVTVTAANANAGATTSTISVLESQAAAGNCGVAVKGTLFGLPRGLVYQTATSNYVCDTAGLGPYTSTQLRAQAGAGTAVWTFTGTPPGGATRIGVDRDLDGTLDGNDGVLTYGASTPGQNGPILLDGNKKPRIGTTGFALAGTHAVPGASGLFAWSPAQASIPIAGVTALVDFNNPSFGYANCVADANGIATISGDIANDPLLVGQFINVQLVVSDVSMPGGIAASNGVKVTIRP